MAPYTTLQGTDGIRGRVSRVDPCDHDRNALSYFMASGFLTPSFFEHYTYAYASLLLETSCAQKGDAIAIGWDPRDGEGDFNQAAVSGIRKAGLKAVTIGILPTPAVPLYMLKTGASGCVVLTASHNPSDQNGIKLFHGWTALKFLPPDDAQLSRTIFEQQDLDLDRVAVLGEIEDQAEAAKAFFIQYQTDPRNSWIENETFEDQVLVIDASKGAVASVVREIFSHYRFKEIRFTNMAGGINECCGVADLEGQELIRAADIIEPESRFYQYEALRTIMELAHSGEGFENGHLKLSGLVFDGDGDRCFRLDYDPNLDAIIVSSGDQLGIHLARYIRTRDGLDGEESWFINTVESDLKTAITAEEEGFHSVITGVGDKWILKQAVLDMIRADLQAGNSQAEALQEILDIEENAGELSGLDISKAWKAYIQCGSAAGTEKRSYRYQVGIEESGHSIIPGYLDHKSGPMICFAGNGIKSGLNVLQAIEKTAGNRTFEERLSYLRYPFQAGIKETSYTYYVNKDNLLPESRFRLELEAAIQQEVNKELPQEYRAEQICFSEEASLIYFRLLKGDKTKGALFVRNSGTEDKSALYLRGEPEIEAFLEQIGLKLHLFLLKGLKNRESEFVILEKKLLLSVSQNLSLEPLREEFPELPFDRMLKEVEFKEKLVAREGQQLKLTEKGKILNDYWEAQD